MFLTEEQVKFYQENGYICLSNIFTKEEIEECSAEYDRLFESKKKANNVLESRWDGTWEEKGEEKEKTSVLSIHNLQLHSAIFTKMLLNDNLTAAVADIIGSPNVLLHHTKAHIKPPEVGMRFPMHQDYPYFPFKKHTMVAAFVNMDDSDPENGGLAIFPGSHKLGPLENKSDVPTHFWVDQEKYPIKDATPVYSKKGDVVIFSYFTIHGSYHNKSTRNRRMLLVQLMAAEDEPAAQVHMSPCMGMVLRGINPDRDANFYNRH